jgi:hypothetical protein
MSAPPTTVARLALRGLRPGDTAMALQASRLVGAIAARPSGLPPAAVLCVRRLSDPLPGRLRLDAGAIRPPPAWEAAVDGALEQALRGAARPAHEAVPAAANAVRFADRGELLACLAADWLTGELAARWWWIAIVAGRPPEAAVPALWQEAPHHVPAALEVLAARGLAPTFGRAVPAAQATAIVLGLASAFALPVVAAAAETIRRPGVPGAPPARAPRPAPVAPPWRVSAPEATADGVGPVSELLLGVALTLMRAPATVRMPEFAAALSAWADHVAVRVPEPRHTASRPAALPARKRRARPDGSLQAPSEPAAGVPAAASQAPVPAAGAARSAGTKRLAAEGPAGAAATRAPGVQGPAGREPGRLRRRIQMRPAVPATGDRPDRAAGPRLVRPAQAAAPAVNPAGPLDEVVETRLGGIFFLANVALHLGLVADFSAPQERGAGLDPWDLLVMLAHELLDEHDAGDPVWALLARLAHRSEREPPGHGFEPDDDWRVPPAWLAPWHARGTWVWSAARGRLRVRHPAGFLIVDVRGDVGALARELAPYGEVRARRGNIAGPSRRGRPAVRWARRLAAYVRPRLALALGVDDPALLLRRPARVHVTPTHLDVELVLATHPLQIRLAGLDRDVGWIPAAGRFLAFHFR